MTYGDWYETSDGVRGRGAASQNQVEASIYRYFTRF